MKGYPKFLNKKRTIFKIEKNQKKFREKLLQNQFLQQKPIESSNNNFSLDEQEEKNSSSDPSNIKQYPRNSLIAISSKVFKFIESKKTTVGPDVTQYILDSLQKKSTTLLNYKNVQRRVYDAINVMCSINLISKNKQEIKFLPQNNSRNSLNQILTKCQQELDELQKILLKLFIEANFNEKFIKLNHKKKYRKKNEDILDFPFYLIEKNSELPYKVVENRPKCVILSDSFLNVITPFDIMKNLIFQDIFGKIGDYSNNCDDEENENGKDIVINIENDQNIKIKNISDNIDLFENKEGEKNDLYNEIFNYIKKNKNILKELENKDRNKNISHEKNDFDIRGKINFMEYDDEGN